MLTRNPHYFLGGRGARVWALVQAQEHVFELHHARVGEQQSRVIARNERRRWDDLVAHLLEEVQERLARFGAGHAFHRGVLSLKCQNIRYRRPIISDTMHESAASSR